MGDSVSTFKAVCRGGLNSGTDVLSLGEEASGAATQLVNYEPNLEGGYRKINGYANNFGTVTGTGSVLGVTIVNGINQGVLACRTPSSGNNYLHHWNFYYSFNVASDTNLTVGQTLTERTTAGDASTATTITGTLISKSSNTIVVNFGQTPSAVFTNGSAISDDSFDTNTTISTAPAEIGWAAVSTSGSPTMTNVSKVRFTEINFGTPKVVLTDGINPAATYDGSTYTQITGATYLSGGSSVVYKPKFAEEFQRHLFIAGDPAQPSMLTFSAPTAETDFAVANGSDEINVGFEIIAIKKFRNVLYIFGKNQIKRLVGNNDSDFRLETVTSNLGCLATDSVIELGGDLLFLAPDGIRPIGGTNKIGDVNLETISKNIQSAINTIITTEDLSTLTAVILRSKSQFRYMFSSTSSTGVLGALREYKGQYTFEFGQTSGLNCTCADSGYIGTVEFVIHGDSSGKVFQQESGNAFDTGNILSVYKTPFIYMDNPEQRKNYYSVSTYMSSEGVNNILLGVTYDYEGTSVLNPENLVIDLDTPASFYDSGTNIAVYDTTDIYDGNPSPVESSTFSGSGKSVSFRYVTDDTNPSHSIQGYTVTYGTGDVR
tara:strand:- start:315 stop:2120 length:1806 start_codon:yes stop_codon:yes gene_type:complete